MTQRVLILEDQPFQRGYLANLFGSRGGVQVDACEDVEAAIALADCLIDFTRPQGTLAHLALCRKHKTAMVIGTRLAASPLPFPAPVISAPSGRRPRPWR